MKGVMNALSGHYEKVPGKLRRNKWLAWLFFIVATVFFVIGMGKTKFDMTVEGWFEQDDPIIVAFDWFHHEFGSEDHLYVVYKPKDGNVFSEKSLNAVKGIRQDLLARMAKVSQENDSALKHITKITTLDNAAVLIAHQDALVSRYLVEGKVPSSTEALDQVRQLAYSQKEFPMLYFSEQLQYGGIFIETDFGAIGVDEDGAETVSEDLAFGDDFTMFDEGDGEQQRPKFKPTDISDYIALMDEIKVVLNDPKYAEHLEYYPVGNTAMMEYNLEMITEMGMFNMLALLIIALLLWFLFRSLSAVVWAITIVVLSVIWTFGLIGWLGLPITSFVMITVMLILTVGVADVVHIMTGYTVFRNKDESHEESLRLAFRKAAVPCLLTALTTMIAMLTLSTTAMIPVIIFGFMSAVGVGMAFLLSIYLLPLMLDLWAPVKRKVDEQASSRQFMPNMTVVLRGMLEKVLPLVEKCPRVIVSVFIGFFVLFIYGATTTKVDTNPLGQFPQDSKIRTSFEIVDNHMMGTQSIEIYMDMGQENAFHDPFVLKQIEQLQQQLEKDYGHLVVRTTSLVDIVKHAYKTLNQGREEMYVIPETQQLVSQTLFLFNNANPSVRARQVSDNYDRARIGVRLHNTGSYEYAELFERMRKDIKTVEAKLQQKYPDASISITGMLALMMHGADYLSQAQLESFALALVFISVILLVVFGSLRAGSIAIIPNLIPAMLAFGLLGLFGIPLDFNTIMIAPVIIGIAVDDTVHFISRYRQEILIDGDIKRALHTTITEGGMAIVFTTLILGLGFGIMAFSESAGTSNVGTFGSLAIMAGMLNDLFLLPAMILIFKPKFGFKSSESKQPSYA